MLQFVFLSYTSFYGEDFFYRILLYWNVIGCLIQKMLKILNKNNILNLIVFSL